jgi:hypothetical protein
MQDKVVEGRQAATWPEPSTPTVNSTISGPPPLPFFVLFALPALTETQQHINQVSNSG